MLIYTSERDNVSLLTRIDLGHKMEKEIFVFVMDHICLNLIYKNVPQTSENVNKVDLNLSFYSQLS